MSDYTITYSESVKGFPSFYSYIPEYIIGMSTRSIKAICIGTTQT